MTEPKSRHVIDGIESTMLLAGMEVEQPRLAQWLKLRNVVFWHTRNNILAFKDTIFQLVMSRVALQKQQHIDDIFGDLLGHRVGEGGPELSVDELMADAFVMVIAGMNSHARSNRYLRDSQL